MTRSNRLLNRLILGLVALVLLAASALMAQSQLDRLLPGLPLVRVPQPTPSGLWFAAGACAIVIVLAIAWIATRGRGRTPRMLTDVADSGAVEIDSHVVSDLVGDAFAANPDVVTAGASVFVVRGRRMLSIRIEARRGADLPALVNSAETIVSHLDDVLQVRIPVLVQFASGLRSAVARQTRVS